MSDSGNLSYCLVNADGVAIGRARLLRSRALLASLVLEAAAIAAMLLWPLVTPAVLPPQIVVTPIPPFQGVGKPHVRSSEPNHDPKPKTDGRTFTPHFQPPRTPERVDTTPDVAPPAIGERPGIPEREAPLEWVVGEHRDGERSVIPPPSSAPRRISTGVMDAMLIHRVQPEYPLPARVMHLSGTVNLRAIIGTDGAVRELQALSGNPIFVRAALAAVGQWRYQPTRLSGEPVEVETYITVNFVFE